MKTLARAALVALFVIASTVGCAAFGAAVPAITTVLSIVSTVSTVIVQVAAFVRSYFAQHPDAAAEAAVQDALAKTAAAAQGIAALGQMGIDADQGKIAAALGDFQTVYADLLAIIGKLPGVKVAHPGSAAALHAEPGVKMLVVPPPTAFKVSAR